MLKFNQLCIASLGVVLSFTVFSGCAEKDQTAPPAPQVDVVDSPTDQGTQWITGSAEYGATVTLTGGLEEVVVTADPFTAVFRAEVSLMTTMPAGESSVLTTISVTATDADKNISQATVIEITYEPELNADKTAPLVPVVEAVAGDTNLATVVLKGSAEPGTTLKVTGGSTEVTTSADDYTALYTVDVPLNTTIASGDTTVVNTLTVVAVDAAGNVSNPVTVTITYAEPQPDRIHLQATPNNLSADDGTLVLTATVVDHEAIDLAGYPVIFNITGMITAPTAQSVNTDANGVAVATFTNLHEAVNIVATATTGVLSASQDIVVSAGAPAAITFALTKVGDTVALAGSPVGIQVEDQLDVTPVVTDQRGNVVDIGVMVATDVPGALVGGYQISQIERIGNYHVVATVIGTSVTSTTNITVGAGAAHHIALHVAPLTVVAGQSVSASATVLDKFNNNTGDAATLTLNHGPTQLQGGSGSCPTGQDVATGSFISCVSGQSVTVTASFTGATDVAATVDVIAAAPSVIADFEPTSGTLTGITTSDIIAGDELSYSYSVTDMYGNNVIFPVTVTVNNPDAVILDDGLSGNGKLVGLTRAGSYTVKALLSGATAKTFTVVIAEDTTQLFVTLVPSVSNIATGDSLYLQSVTRDIYGNVIANANYNYTVNTTSCDTTRTLGDCLDPTASNGVPTNWMTTAALTATSQELTIVENQAVAHVVTKQVGVYAITATFINTAGGTTAFANTQYVSVSPVIDVTPPIARISRAFLNGIVTDCLTAAATTTPCEFISGQDILIFDVIVTDETALAELSYSAFFATNGANGTLINRSMLLPSAPATTSRTATFMMPINGAQEDVSLVAQAIDSSGNVSNSQEFVIHVRVPPPVLPVGVTNTVGVAGTVSAIAGVTIVDSARDYLGNLIVVEDNTNLVLQINPDGSSYILARLPDRPRSLVTDSTGHIYISMANRRGQEAVYMIDQTASPITMEPYIDFAADVVGTAKAANAACDPGQGPGAIARVIEPMSMAVARVGMSHMRISPNPTPGLANAFLTVSDIAAGGAVNTNVTVANSVALTATALHAAYVATPTLGISSFVGPALIGAASGLPDYADLTLFANQSVGDNAYALSSSNTVEVTFDGVAPGSSSNITTRDMLFVGDRQNPDVYGIDLSKGPVTTAATIGTAAPTCFDVAISLGTVPGSAPLTRTDGGIAVGYNAAGTALNLYAADNGNSDEIVAYDLLSQVETVVAEPGVNALVNISELAYLPSGCLMMQADDSLGNATAVWNLDVRSTTSPCGSANIGGGGASPTCAETELMQGILAPGGLALDYADLTADRIHNTAPLVALTARIPGAAANSLALSTTAAGLTINDGTVLGFTGGVDAVLNTSAAVTAKASITVTAALVVGDTLTVGSNTYEVVSTSTAAGVSAVPISGNIPINLLAVQQPDLNGADVTIITAPVNDGSAAANAVMAGLITQAIMESEARLLITDNDPAVNFVYEMTPTPDRTDCF